MAEGQASLVHTPYSTYRVDARENEFQPGKSVIEQTWQRIEAGRSLMCHRIGDSRDLMPRVINPRWVITIELA